MKILRRIGIGLLAFVLLIGAGPPLFYSVVSYELPELPPAGKRMPVGNGRFVNAIDRGQGPAVVLGAITGPSAKPGPVLRK